VARGARVIEKHFTLDRSMEGPDHVASIEPDELKAMVDGIRKIEVALGDGLKQPTAAEREISKVVLKRIVAAKPIPCGKVIADDDICVKRNNVGLPADAWDVVVGTKARRAFVVDEGIEL